MLGGIQIVATALIMFYAARYKDTSCPIHVPRQLAAKTATTAQNMMSAVATIWIPPSTMKTPA